MTLGGKIGSTLLLFWPFRIYWLKAFLPLSDGWLPPPNKSRSQTWDLSRSILWGQLISKVWLHLFGDREKSHLWLSRRECVLHAFSRTNSYQNMPQHSCTDGKNLQHLFYVFPVWGVFWPVAGCCSLEDHLNSRGSFNPRHTPAETPEILFGVDFAL